MKKTSLKELRSFSKAELIRYVQYVEGEPLRAHHTAARTYIYELRLERVNKRYDAAKCPDTVPQDLAGAWGVDKNP
ncbi:MAG: hypothetical protein E7G07_12265 [Flavonifractor plautii]|nr:hypothetical protein [Flavonifractor plautii]